MKATIKFFRATKVPSTHLWAAAGLEPNEPVDKVREAIKRMYAPFAPRLAIFWQQETTAATVVGVEIMGFSVDASDDVPRAGLVQCDPASSDDVHRADGALQSELERIGIWTETKNYEWRAWYQTSRKEPGQ